MYLPPLAVAGLDRKRAAARSMVVFGGLVFPAGAGVSGGSALDTLGAMSVSVKCLRTVARGLLPLSLRSRRFPSLASDSSPFCTRASIPSSAPTLHGIEWADQFKPPFSPAGGRSFAKRKACGSPGGENGGIPKENAQGTLFDIAVEQFERDAAQDTWLDDGGKVVPEHD